MTNEDRLCLRSKKARSTLVRNGSAECRLLRRGTARLPKPRAVMASRLSSLQGASAQADNHVLLDEEEHRQHWGEDNQARGHDHSPVDNGGVVEVGDADRQGFQLVGTN